MSILETPDARDAVSRHTGGLMSNAMVETLPSTTVEDVLAACKAVREESRFTASIDHQGTSDPWPLYGHLFPVTGEVTIIDRESGVTYWVTLDNGKLRGRTFNEDPDGTLRLLLEDLGEELNKGL